MAQKPEKIKPLPGQESVWDYPRPPRLARSEKHVQVVFNGVMIADSVQAYRVLETSHPPVYYIPEQDIQMKYLSTTGRNTFCEFKGAAIYYSVQVGNKSAANAAWSYPNPSAGYAEIRDHLAFYPALMDQCFVDGEMVTPQPGGFYGGWITRDVVGPFKGEPGSWGW